MKRFERFETLPPVSMQGDAIVTDQVDRTAMLQLARDIVKANGAKPKTVNGQSLDVVVRDGKVLVNGGNVIQADVVASNGVIHVIDTVLIPAAPATVGQ